ncbi:alpha/beta hydrolase [Nonomuraea longicatena]|uniref:Alpha/beta hydrolase n=1 Tax=Nonomuraea longicatena TaxID=83682 RepID=A0ABN1R0M7_9ACTN
MTTTRTLAVPGARLHYEVRGTGPVLVIMGSPMDAAAFAPIAEAMASDHTVVTLDPRGISGSELDDPKQESTPDLRADDVAAILDDLGVERADVLGSSGGAVTALALVTRHPNRVGTVVAHEPPLLELLPDAAERRAATDDIVATFHRDGIGAAWMKFMGSAGFEADDEGAPVEAPEEPSLQDLANSARFFAYELQATTRYVPDVAALTAGPARVVVGLGKESGKLDTFDTSKALAEVLGTQTVEFPGDHGGFIGETEDFAATLRKVLAG